MKLLNQKIITLIQIIVSVFFMYSMISSGLFPIKYIIIFALILLFLLVLFHVLMKPKTVPGPRHARGVSRKKYGKRQVTARIISLLVSVVLGIASTYIGKGSKTLVNLTSSNNTIVTRYNLYVLKNKGYSLSSLNNQTIANAGSFDAQDYNIATNDLKKQLKYSPRSYTSYQQMANDFYNGKVAGILMNGYYEMMMKKYHPGWSNDVTSVWHTDMKETAGTTAAAKNFADDAFTIYISGVDSRGGVTKTSRSDSNMILTVNPRTKQILMTSIPRDYYVDMAMATGARDKLTHAALFGTINSLKTIEKFMNIDIDFYCRVNFQALIKIVDALGGIRVYSDKAFTPWTNHKVRVQQGWQTMDGKTALAFARERKTYTEGDRHRAANQQAVLKAIMKKMMSPSVLTHFSSLMDSISGLFETDITTAQMKQLINYQLNNAVSWNIQSSVLKGNSEKRFGGFFIPHTAIYYMIPDQASINLNANYIKAMESGKKIKVSTDNSLSSETSYN